MSDRLLVALRFTSVPPRYKLAEENMCVHVIGMSAYLFLYICMMGMCVEQYVTTHMHVFAHPCADSLCSNVCFL